MIVKCRNREYDLTDRDIIGFNGSVYWIHTRKYFQEWSYRHPTLAKKKAKEMINNGELVYHFTSGTIKYFKVVNNPWKGEL